MKNLKKLQRKAKRPGAKSLDYSNRKNNKYDGKKIHFGSIKFEDYLIHKDKKRREKYLARAKKIKNKKGEFTFEDPNSANYWAVLFLWSKIKLRFKEIIILIKKICNCQILKTVARKIYYFMKQKNTQLIIPNLNIRKSK